MSVLEREISPGFPADNRVFEPPQVSHDKSKTRYLSFMGSLVTPQALADRPVLYGGGIEVANPCLRVVHNFLRKGRITPLIRDVHNYQSIDTVRKIVDGDPLQHGYFSQPTPPGYTPPMLPPPRGMGNGTNPSPTGNLVATFAYPGDQMDKILRGEANFSHIGVFRGIVELSSLKDHDYRPQQTHDGFYDVELWKIQKAVFPTYPILPELLDDLARLLDAATDHTALRTLVDELTVSLTQFVDYANITLQNTHTVMKESGGVGGYVPRYTDLDLVLLKQLGMERQDRDIARQRPAVVNNDIQETFKAFLESQVAEKQAMTELYKVQLAQKVDQNTMAAAPIAEKGYDGYPGQSGYSGFSGEVVEQQTAAEPEGEKRLHWKVRQKIERERLAAEAGAQNPEGE